MSRVLTYTPPKIVTGYFAPSPGLTVTINDKASPSTVLATAVYDATSGTYVATFNEVNKRGVWVVNNITKPDLGYEWMGYKNQEKAVIIFKDIAFVDDGSGEMTITTGTSPLDEDSDGNTVLTFVTAPIASVSNYGQDRVLYVKSTTLNSNKTVTMVIKQSDVGDEDTSITFDLHLTLGE
jgi:hypothetical protein